MQTVSLHIWTTSSLLQASNFDLDSDLKIISSNHEQLIFGQPSTSYKAVIISERSPMPLNVSTRILREHDFSSINLNETRN